MSMPNKKHETGGVPERLRQITVETLPVEVPYVPDVDPYTELPEVIYIDKTQADGMGRLAVDGRQPVKLLDMDKLPAKGTVILMNVWVQADEGGLRQGIVADCRRYDGMFDVVDGLKEIDFTDQEEAWDTLEMQQHQVVISAVVDNDSKGETGVWGDPAFYDAALHMAKLVNKESKKHATAEADTKKQNKKSHKKSKKSKG